MTNFARIRELPKIVNHNEELALGDLLLNAYLLLKRNWLIILICLIAGVGLVMLKDAVDGDDYTTSLTVHSDVLPEEGLNAALAPVVKAVQKRDFSSMPPFNSSQIGKMQTRPLFKSGPTVEYKGQFMEINITASNQESGYAFADSVVSFLTRESMLADHYATERAILEDKHSSLSAEIKQLEELTAMASSQAASSNLDVFDGDLGSLFESLRSLYVEQSDTKRELEMLAPIEVVVPAHTVSDSLSLTSRIMLGLGIGLVLAILLVLLLESRRYIKSRL